MQVEVNGESRDVADGLTVSGLLEQLQVPPERVVVEVNLTILRRHQLPQTVLRPGDRIEIVHFVGGGAEPDDPCRRSVSCAESAGGAQFRS